MKLFKKKNIAAIALSMSLVIGLTGCGKKPEGVVATVNEEPITVEEYILEYATMRNSFIMDAGQGDAKILDEKIPELDNKTADEFIREMTLENLEKIKLIEQDAKKYGIEVTEDDVNKLMQTEIEAAGGEEALNESLAKQGISKDFYKTYLERKVLTAKYYNKKFEKISPTEEEIKKYYDEHKDEFYTAKASHILVEDKKEASEIKKELDKGANFEKLAKEKSIEPAAKESGGSLGEFTSSTNFDPDFLAAITKMKAGEISDPVQTQFGYHIIKLDEKKARTFDEVKEEIKAKLLMDKEMQYNEKLEKEAKYKTYMDLNKDIVLPDEYKLDSEKQAEAKEKQAEDKKDEKTETKTDAKAETKEEVKDTKDAKAETKDTKEKTEKKETK